MGPYDFHESMVCQTLATKDLALGDLRNQRIIICQVISFNAPSEVVPAIKDAGYDDLRTQPYPGFRRSHIRQLRPLKIQASHLSVFTHEKGPGPLVIKGEWHQDCYSSLRLWV